MRLVTILATLFVCTAPPAMAQPRSSGAAAVEAHVRATIALWDRLQQCRRAASFRAAGLGAGGPCAGWVDRAETLQDSPLTARMIAAGYDCLPGDVLTAGTTLAMGGDSPEDREFVSWVRSNVEACRTKLAAPH